VSPTRSTDYVHCGRAGQAGTGLTRTLWALAPPIIRDGRVQLGVPGRLVQEFAETDYCYGIGPLTMKVDRVEWDRPVPHEGDTWLEVEGTLIDRAGREGGRKQVLVRAGRLPEPPPRKRPRMRP
jgi:hypothetical protein